MAYCKSCGNQIDDNAEFCNNCGARQSGSVSKNSNDTGGFGWGLLGFCIPLVGLILYLVWKDTQPNNAKASGKGALIGFILTIIVYIFYFVFLIGYLAEIGTM